MDVNEDDASLDIVLKFINKYLEPDPIGPFINGDLVIQASSYHSTHVPALCRIEFAADEDEDFREVLRIMPWDMIYQPPEGEGGDQVTIPVQLPPDCQEGTVHVMVYVDETAKISYTEVDENFDVGGESLILAVDFTTRATAGGGGEGGEAGTDEVCNYTTITAIKVIHRDEDDMGDGGPLSGGGLSVCPVFDLSGEGGLGGTPAAGSWTFSVCVSTTTGPVHEEGVEDIIFVSSGGPDMSELEVPDGYILDEFNLLGGPAGEAEGEQVRV